MRFHVSKRNGNGHGKVSSPPLPERTEVIPEGNGYASGTGASTPQPPLRADTGSSDQSPRSIQRFVRHDGICVLTFDRPDSTANIFDRRTLLELQQELDFIASAPYLAGLVLTSAKPTVFIAGADLKMLFKNASSAQIRELIELGQAVMNRFAALPIPTAAAIHGAALGGGCELSLACDYRIASNDNMTRIGLPETQLGLLPAWGGSTRLPRLIGLPKALDIILAGKTLAPKQALKCGLVDQLAPREYLLQVALEMLGRGKPHRRHHLFLNNWLVGTVLGRQLRRKLLKKTRGHYPAVLAALSVATRGISKPLTRSLALERESILELVQTESCRNLIGVFFLQERAKKRTLTSAEPKPVTGAAVIGAGVMGAGIAQWLSSRNVSVILKDISPDYVARGMGAIANLYREGAKRHVFTPLEVRQGLDRIYPVTQDVPLRRVEVVIEAAVEQLELKQQLFHRLEALAGDDTILATNTSALSISEIAAVTRLPDRVLGLHFFNPVHRMPLVEIVAGRRTSSAALQRALRFVQQRGKFPVLVKDSPGFLVNRILMPYLLEAGHLFEAGAGVTELDEAMLQFGMPMGPMRLLDEVGIDVALHVAKTLAGKFADRMKIPQTLGKMLEAGMLGRKSGRGFYIHAKGQETKPNQQMGGYHSPGIARRFTILELQERMVLLMINEAARCLEEEVVLEPADVDFGMIMGTGFAPFRGGPLRYADTLGLAAVAGALSRLADSGAAHFEPCTYVRSLAARGAKFYQ